MSKYSSEHLTTGQAASLLNIAPGTLQNWRTQGLGPKFIKHHRNVFYARSEIERYKAENFLQFSSTAEWKESIDKQSDEDHHE